MSQFSTIFPVAKPVLKYIIIIPRKEGEKEGGRGRRGEGEAREDIKRKEYSNSTYDQESE